jgi:hypothetical protein
MKGTYDPNETPEQLAARLVKIQKFVDEVNKQAGITVHVLLSGLPLCRFSIQMPVDWPPGHRWVSLHNPEMANCEGCLVLVKQMKGGGDGA